jgi:hypothetical protein
VIVTGMIVVVIVRVIMLGFGFGGRLCLGQGFAKFAFGALHMNSDTVPFNRAGGGDMHTVGATGLIRRQRRLAQRKM